jgi:hypothetical protein
MRQSSASSATTASSSDDRTNLGSGTARPSGGQTGTVGDGMHLVLAALGQRVFSCSVGELVAGNVRRLLDAAGGT